MASTLPAVRGVAFPFDISLVSQADTDIFQSSPTLAAGDVLVIKDGVIDGNIDTLPVAITGALMVLGCTLSATEMTADRVTVIFHDAAGAEWQDAVVTIYTAAQTLDATDGIADDVKATVNHTDYGNAKLARTGADADTLETLSDQIDVAQTDLDNPAQYKADVSALALQASVDDLEGRLTATRAGYLDNLSGGAAALQASVDDLEGRLTAIRAGYLDNLSAGAVPTAVQNATELLDHALAAHDTAGTVGAKLNDVQTLGSGAITFTYTLTSSVDATPIADADVWVTTDAAGSNVVASGQTNASGIVTFYLDAGTVYVFRQKSGWDFDPNPDTEVVA